MSSLDRRRYPRRHAEFACKIRCPSTGRYLRAQTSDLSEGGAMLTVQTPRPLADGQAIEIALRDDGHALIHRADLIRAQIVRSSARLDRHQVLAVQFDRPQAQLALPERAAAA